MTKRTAFLLEQTRTASNKCSRTPLPAFDVSFMPLSIPERKAHAFALICQNMPLFIGEQELIVGTRTFFTPHKGNEDGSDKLAYTIHAHIPYLTNKELEKFGESQSYINKGHCTPDLGLLLEKGIDGIIHDAESRMSKLCTKSQGEFLSSVIIAYNGLKSLILRYSEYALDLSLNASGEERVRLEDISRTCAHISGAPPRNFRQAVQLFWFGHLGCIMESSAYVCYGRADVILGRYLLDCPQDDAQQLIDCLMLKMYDQADLTQSYFKNYTSQLVITLGGVLENGENAVNRVTMMFLDAADRIRLPEPEFNLRLSGKNPPEFLEKASKMSVSGCNFISYYNDDLFVENLINAGIKPEDARSYGFDLCQDITIPGKADFYAAHAPSLIHILMNLLNGRHDHPSFEELINHFKEHISACVDYATNYHNTAQKNIALYREERYDEYFDAVKRGEPADLGGKSPASPLPLLSGMFYGCIDTATDFTLEGYPIKHRGAFFGGCVEAINALAAIKAVVFDQKKYTLEQVYAACLNNFQSMDEKKLQAMLNASPKWGNDDPYVDLIAKDILEYSLSTLTDKRTYSGGKILGGIHQPHPVVTGSTLMATPDGRNAADPISVTLTPKSGSAKKGATAILNSALNIDPSAVQWNFCVMVNYFSSVFSDNGDKLFRTLLTSFFNSGGLQHQPNVTNVEDLKKAKLDPDAHRDIIVRMWGVSAIFADLPSYLQDEMISRFE